MSFFGKLKAKLFKSSSKLDGDINSLISKGGKSSEEISALESTSDCEVDSFNDREDLAKEEQSSENAVINSDKKKNKSLLSKIIEPVANLVKKRRIDDDLLESLEDLLIASDLGINTAMKVSSKLSEKYAGKEIGSDEIKVLLSEVIEEILIPVAKPLTLLEESPQVILMVGVNGGGKTTTIGKLADKYKKMKKSVMIAACDTYRAAAVDQLKIWAERAGAFILTGQAGTDPASLAFDAYAKAAKEKIDVLLIDTAGRLQNKTDLMDELGKITRVLKKQNPIIPHNRIIVLDATTGQNALSQVDQFSKVCDLTGIIMTKLDGTARGGVLVAIADKFSLPVHYIGVGETLDDLQTFKAIEFANAITGVSDNNRA